MKRGGIWAFLRPIKGKTTFSCSKEQNQSSTSGPGWRSKNLINSDEPINHAAESLPLYLV